MRRHTIPWILIVVALFVGWVLAPARPVESDDLQAVVVTNFPDPQNVRGEVKIVEPLRQSELIRFTDVLVPPVERRQTTRLVDAGVLESNGFPFVVLSLQGQVKGDVQRPGEVGAILVPVQDPIREAFDDLGLIQFPLEVIATGVSRDTPYFSSPQPRHTVGFQAYRIFIYNTTDKTVTINLYAYLTG